MEYCTGNSYMSDKARALDRMERFIQMYKHNPGTAQTKGSEIRWVDNAYLHSVRIKDDKFIIDGSEFNIDSQLWNKYAKMRELTGSILVLPPVKFMVQKLSDKIKQIVQKVR